MAESLSDSVSFKLDISKFTRVMEDAKRTSERATMYALRETGRQIGAKARAEAPTYEGDDPRVVKGLLKRSIHNAKVLNHGGGEFSLKVGPMAPVTREEGKGARGAVLYAAKEERKHGYMAKGVATTPIADIYNEAMAKGLAKYR